MATDLSFLIDAAGRASTKLEEALRVSVAQAAPAVSVSPAPDVTAGKPVSAGAQTTEADVPNAKGALHKLAGITTRRRDRDQNVTPAVRRPAQTVPKPDIQPLAPVPPEAHRPRIKMAG